MTVPSISSETPMTIESDSSNGADKPKRSRQLRSSSHFMSLSVDADFFDGLRIADGGGGGGEDDGFGGNPAVVAVMAMMMDNAKKSLGPDKLAELSLIDPKRAKRILANRQSAARSKEQKVRYTSELERKVQTLQTEATTLSAQFTMMQACRFEYPQPTFQKLIKEHFMEPFFVFQEFSGVSGLTESLELETEMTIVPARTLEILASHALVFMENKLVLQGLVYLHNKRHVIHMDIKPSNMLVNRKGEIKITDFGVSAMLANSMGQPNTFVGTYNYMSVSGVIILHCT